MIFVWRKDRDRDQRVHPVTEVPYQPRNPETIPDYILKGRMRKGRM